MAVAEAIADLAPAASRMLSSTGGGSPPPALVLQLHAGCHVVACCSVLAGALQELSPTAAFKISAACSLVFGPCTAWLDGVLSGAQAGAGPDMTGLLGVCKDYLQAVGPALGGELLSKQPKAAAAFANSTGKPAALLPWLRAVSQVLTFANAATNVYDRE